jgi:hypothetical protein
LAAWREAQSAMSLRIPIRRVFVLLSAVTVLIFTSHGITLILRHILGLGLPDWVSARLDPNLEANIPGWYSTMLLASIAAVSLLNHRMGDRTPTNGWLARRFWLLLGGVFAFLSLDEAARLHELIDDPVPGAKWVFYYAPFAALFIAACVYHLARQRDDDPRLRTWILGGMLLMAIGGLGGELLEYSFPMNDVLRRIEMTVEELAEVFGAILVLLGCLREFERRFSLRFAARGEVGA